MEIIFKKPLSETDVNHRLAIPSKKLAEIATLSLGEKVRIAVIDATGNQWSFLLSTRNEGKFLKPVISGKEWLEFVSRRHLREGDNITFYRETNENNEVTFKIGIEFTRVSTVIFGVPIRTS
ncbi:hypothetical protein LWI28_002140 [Acer negundo]|uniref:TF-B3 domain-containing protein n=1 Tax=Acer negundo TaxID=4023 RepID=A0AAD5IYA3_ACENE|nr:hypothetical protein LWI28_002140 [Acer negundo]KAK4835111.1 hypothetical protein QYF36_005353 [Acer negundo]